MKRAALLGLVAVAVFVADLVSRPGLSEGRWAHPAQAAPVQAAALGAASPAQTTPPEARSSADSLRRRVTVGDVLITTLPERVGERRVAAYDMLRTPALSDLAGSSFFWRTRPQDAGRHRLLFGVRFGEDSSARDTLALVVEVE